MQQRISSSWWRSPRSLRPRPAEDVHPVRYFDSLSRFAVTRPSRSWSKCGPPTPPSEHLRHHHAERGSATRRRRARDDRAEDAESSIDASPSAAPRRAGACEQCPCRARRGPCRDAARYAARRGCCRRADSRVRPCTAEGEPEAAVVLRPQPAATAKASPSRGMRSAAWSCAPTSSLVFRQPQLEVVDRCRAVHRHRCDDASRIRSIRYGAQPVLMTCPPRATATVRPRARLPRYGRGACEVRSRELLRQGVEPVADRVDGSTGRPDRDEHLARADCRS